MFIKLKMVDYSIVLLFIFHIISFKLREKTIPFKIKKQKSQKIFL